MVKKLKLIKKIRDGSIPTLVMSNYFILYRAKLESIIYKTASNDIAPFINNADEQSATSLP